MKGFCPGSDMRLLLDFLSAPDWKRILKLDGLRIEIIWQQSRIETRFQGRPINAGADEDNFLSAIAPGVFPILFEIVAERWIIRPAIRRH